MADEGSYELEPIKPDAPGGTPPPPAGSMPSAPAAKPGKDAPNASLNAPGLLSDFDEDADFSENPRPSAIPAKRPATLDDDDPTIAWPPIVTDASIVPVLGNAKTLGIIGGVLLVLAVVVTSIATKSSRPLIPPLITLYEGIVHTGTGVVAVLVAARFAERRVNRVDLIAARMLVLVSIFLAIKNTNIPIPGRIEEPLVAAAVYYGVLLVLFRLPRFETGLIGGTHFCLWVLSMLGQIMYEVNAAAPQVVPVAPTGT